MNALKRRTKVAAVAVCTALAATTVTPAVAQPQPGARPGSPREVLSQLQGGMG